MVPVIPAKIQVKQAFMFARLENNGILIKADNGTYYVDTNRLEL